MVQPSQSPFTLASTLVVVAMVSLMSGGCRGNVRPTPAASSFTATAYCTGTVTAMGTKPDANTVAADPAVLPLGSRIKLSGLHQRYNGVYTVMDTGSKVRGRRIDLYIRNCREAVRFGRRSARVSILR